MPLIKHKLMKPLNNDLQEVFLQAQNINCDLVTLLTLSHHNDDRVRAAAAMNPKLPLSRIMEMVEENKESSNVLSSLASNVNADDEVFKKIFATPVARGDFQNFHQSIALWRFIKTSEQYNRLIQELNFFHTMHLSDKYEVWDDETIRILLNHEDSVMRNWLIKNPNIPEEILWKLSDDKEFSVLRTLGYLKTCPTEILVKLSTITRFGKHDLIKLKTVLAQNPNTPFETIKSFLEYDNSKLGEALITHPDADKEIIEHVLKGKRTNQLVKKHALKKLAALPEFEDFPMEWLEALYGVKARKQKK